MMGWGWVPARARDRRQPRVDGDSRAPAIERRVAFHDGGRAHYLGPQPHDGVIIVLQLQGPVFVIVDGPPHESEAIVSDAPGCHQRLPLAPSVGEAVVKA